VQFHACENEPITVKQEILQREEKIFSDTSLGRHSGFKLEKYVQMLIGPPDRLRRHITGVASNRFRPSRSVNNTCGLTPKSNTSEPTSYRSRDIFICIV